MSHLVPFQHIIDSIFVTSYLFIFLQFVVYVIMFAMYSYIKTVRKCLEPKSTPNSNFTMFDSKSQSQAFIHVPCFEICQNWCIYNSSNYTNSKSQKDWKRLARTGWGWMANNYLSSSLFSLIVNTIVMITRRIQEV